MTAISKKFKNVYVRPFEKTVFGDRVASLSVYVNVFSYGRQMDQTLIFKKQDY
jgi:hypothetical protein